MTHEPKDLGEYLRSIETALKEGHDTKFGKIEDIILELAIVNTKEGGGGFKILVVELGGKFKKEEISKITIKLKPYTSVGIIKVT